MEKVRGGHSWKVPGVEELQVQSLETGERGARGRSTECFWTAKADVKGRMPFDLGGPWQCYFPRPHTHVLSYTLKFTPLCILNELYIAT